MAWLELAKCLVAGGIGYWIASHLVSRWAKSGVFFLAVILGQAAAIAVGYVLIVLDPSIFNPTDFAKSAFIPWSSMLGAGIGLLLAGRRRAAEGAGFK